MDFLLSAYPSDPDDGDGGADGTANLQPPSKKTKFPHRNHHQNYTTNFRPQSFPAYRPYHTPTPMPSFQPEPPVPGRYVSKRERAALMEPSNQTLESSHPPPVGAPSVTCTGSISDSNLPRDLCLALKQHKNGGNLSRLPERLSVSLNGHSKAVNTVQWSPTHSHLLASAGMDNTVCIWNVWSQDQKARVLNNHTAAVKDVKWSTHGLSVLSCGYDCTLRLVDVEKGVETQVFKEDQVVGVVKFHPKNHNLFISGGSKGQLKLYDIRAGKVIHEYHRRLGPILDVEFINDAKQFVSSSDVSGSNISENSIIVWDVLRQVPLSNQVYVEAFTCPSIKSHPSDPHFIVQSNGNYIAIFSTTPPYKLDKYKRYEGHGVAGFPIKCTFSLDGNTIACGSYDGHIYLYNYHSSHLIKKIKAYEQPCIDVAFHPTMPNVFATCSWDGHVSIFH